MNQRNIIIVGVLIVVVGVWIAISSGGKEKPAAVEATAPEARELYQQARSFRKEGDPVKARQLYQEILSDHPDAENIAAVQDELETLNLNLILSNTAVDGKTIYHTVVTGDTLGKLAKQYGTTIELIKRSNNLKSDVIRIGQKLRIWQGDFNLFVDKSQNILILKDGNEVVKVYRVSTGENNSTPVGEFTITTRLVDPVWFNRGAIVPPDSPANVLGSRWLGFDLPGYGIHGTVEPETIGQQVTAGCVRMVNSDVEELYSLIPKGTKVVVVD